VFDTNTAPVIAIDVKNSANLAIKKISNLGDGKKCFVERFELVVNLLEDAQKG